MGIRTTLAISVLAPALTFCGSLHEAILAQPAFDHFYNLEYDDALRMFTREAAQNPSSADAYNHIAQTVLYKAMYHAGLLSSEFDGGTGFIHAPKLQLSEEQAARFHDALNHAMSLEEDRLAANPNDTRALYSEGVSYGLRANYAFVVTKGWIDALRDASAARKAHRRVTEIDPEFIDAKLTQGVNDYVVGSLPLRWKMFGFLGGFHGDKERGIRTLNEVSERGVMNRVDALVLLAVVYVREHKPEKAIPLLKELTETFPKNTIFKVELEKARVAER